MPPKVRPRRDFHALELRRRDAARRFARGESQAEVAHALSVSRQSVSRWYQQWHANGAAALRGAGRAGRKPRLSAQQLAQVEAALRRGANAHGFATELWTLPRVAEVIRRVADVDYHPGHVWRILRALHWTLQRPARRAIERNEAGIRQWVSQRWPTVKNARRRRALIVFQDESGISQRPSVRRTWAPRGHTPVLVHPFNWKKMSLCAALAYRWDGRSARLFFQMKPGSYNATALIAFLRELRTELPRRRIILIWDGLPAHRSHDMQTYLQTQRQWIEVERLPGYAPELNPTESLWGNIKGRELANFCGNSLESAARQCRKGVHRVRRHRHLLLSFLDHAGLSL